MTAKQALVELANSVPDDIGWEELEYQFFLRKRIQESQEAEARGEIYSTQEVLERLGLCPRSNG
jgi:hypothetical protein